MCVERKIRETDKESQREDRESRERKIERQTKRETNQITLPQNIYAELIPAKKNL